MLFVARISFGDLHAQKSLVRLAGLVLLILLLIDRWLWRWFYPVGLSATDAQNAVNKLLLIGLVAAFLLVLRGLNLGVQANRSSDIVTLQEAADFYLISVEDVEQMIGIGAVEATSIGVRQHVSRDAVGNYLKRGESTNNFLPDLSGSTDEHS